MYECLINIYSHTCTIAGCTLVSAQKETSGALAHTGAHLDLSAFSSAEELASLGLDRLKSALMALGLKCGGTLEERAQRLFSTKGMRYVHLFMTRYPSYSFKERMAKLHKCPVLNL